MKHNNSPFKENFLNAFSASLDTPVKTLYFTIRNNPIQGAELKCVQAKGKEIRLFTSAFIYNFLG